MSEAMKGDVGGGFEFGLSAGGTGGNGAAGGEEFEGSPYAVSI